MKKIIYTTLLITAFGMMACDNRNNSEADRDVKNLRSYLDSVKKAERNSADDYWDRVEKGYEEKKQQVENKAAQMDDKMKKEYADIQNDFREFKEDYIREREQAKEVRKAKLRDALYGANMVNAELKMAFMNETNVVKVYETFVNTVSDHKDEYSKEDWNDIQNLYERMEVRRKEFESKISSKDNRSIAGIKLKFFAIKAVNRPFSESELK